jgi:hypothetical protein
MDFEDEEDSDGYDICKFVRIIKVDDEYEVKNTLLGLK